MHHLGNPGKHLQAADFAYSSSPRCQHPAEAAPTNRGDTSEHNASESLGSDAGHSRQHYYDQRQHSQQQASSDKWSCSCSDELSRLETRLAAMESRLSDFEALLLRSVSGDASSQPQKPTTFNRNAATTSSSSFHMSTDPSSDLKPKPKPKATSAAAAGSAVDRLSSRGDDGTPLNLVFSTDEEEEEEDGCNASTSSVTWTDLGFETANVASGFRQQPQEMRQSAAAVGRAECIVNEQDKDAANSGISDAESFDLVRHSTQESLVPLQQYDLASCSSADSAAAAAIASANHWKFSSPSMWLQKSGVPLGPTTVALPLGPGWSDHNAASLEQDQKRRQHPGRDPLRQHAAASQMMLTTLALTEQHTEPLATPGRWNSGIAELRFEGALPRGLAETSTIVDLTSAAAVYVSACDGDGGGNGDGLGDSDSCETRSLKTATAKAAVDVCETSTASCEPNLAAVVTAADNVRRFATPMDLTSSGAKTASQPAVSTSTTAVAVVEDGNRSVPPPMSVPAGPAVHRESDEEDDACTGDTATFSASSAAAASAAAASASAASPANLVRQRRVPDDRRRSAANEKTANRSKAGRAATAAASCRLCRDLLPYARARLNDLNERSAAPQFRPRRASDVCIQQSGMSRLNTVFIAGLAVKAAALHSSEGDQAKYVRMALRKMGFECAVIIGRHFTGCICGMESSRLLLDIGERSCLIFSFFPLNSDLSQSQSSV